MIDEPKLKDAVITQFLIEDGWMGIALGPKPAVAQRASNQSR